MELKIRFIVDAAHCERAEADLYRTVRIQQLDFVRRFYARRLVTTSVAILRLIGMIVSFVGAALCVWAFWRSANVKANAVIAACFVLFIAFFLVFYFIPKLKHRVEAWAMRRADARSKRYAGRLMKVAKALAPYDADFELKGDLLIYSRGKNGEWKFAWQRSLKKFLRGKAIQGEFVTVLFRRETSLFPAMAILHENPRQIYEALTEIGIRSSTLPNDGASLQ